MRISRQQFLVQAILDQTQLEKLEYFENIRCVITNDVRCTPETKPRIAVVKEAFNKKKTLYTSKLD